MARRVAARWFAWERRAGRFGAAPSAGTASPTPSAVTFPTTDLQCRVWIALTPDYTRPWWEWGWANITEYVRWDPGISVSDGRRDESGTVSTINASMVLENDGRFSRHYAFGPYYGFLTRNTPIWAQVNPGSGWYDRLHGYVNSWPKRWDTTGTDSIAPINIGGVMRRLEQADNLRSALFRSMAGIAEGDFAPVAYWPMEDGENATSLASAISGHPPAAITGTVTLAAYSTAVGSDALPTIASGGQIDVSVPTYTDTGTWQLQFMMVIPSEPSADVDFMNIYTVPGSGSTIARIRVFYDSLSTDITIASYNAAGTELSSNGISPTYATPLLWAVTQTVTAGNLLTFLSEYSEDGFVAQTNLTDSGAAGVVFRVTASATGDNTGWTPGHWALYTDPEVVTTPNITPNSAGMGGHVGEMAHERMIRLCREERVSFYCLSSSSAVLGPQPRGTLLDALRDAEKADLGVLHEHEFGLAYKSPRDYYNQPVHLALDQTEGQLAEFVEADDDDQDYVNQWTASRTDGSSSTFRDPAFDSNYEALFAGGDTYNVETDEQLPHIAGWEVHKGTVDEDRWPMLAINLANHPELITQWTAMPFGGRVQVDNPHEQVGIDTIDAIYEGRTEHWNSKQWNARMNTTPASIHTIAVYDDGVARYGARDSTLSAAVDADDTSWTVDIGTDVWATTASHPDLFPFNIDTGGVTYSCTAITGAVTDTFTRSETDGWGSADTGQAWTLSGGTNPGNYDVDGSQGTHTLDSVNVRRHSLLDTSNTDFDVIADVTLPVVPTGAAITLWLAGRVTDTSNYYAAYLSVATSGTVTLAIGERVAGVSADLLSATAGTHAASDVWRIRFQGAGRALRAMAWNTTTSSEPDGWLVETWDGSLTTGTSVGLLSRLETGNTNGTVTVSWDALNTVLAPLTFTVTRLATDKAHAAGTAVTVTDTAVYGI